MWFDLAKENFLSNDLITYTNDDDYVLWTKPFAATFISIIAVGAGGGGGAGCSAATGSARGGGAGGASGATAFLMLPAELAPNTLWIKPGKGGSGGIASAGTLGGTTHVFIDPAVPIRLLQARGGNGGNVGQVGSSASPGSGNPAFTLDLCQFASNGFWTSTSGTSGSSGRSNPTPQNLTAFNGTSMFSGGSGGGALSAADVVANGDNIVLSGSVGLANITGSSGQGHDGIFSRSPLFGVGGSGGASGVPTGFNGGRGALGAGGGGGGGGETGGNGGDGGHGFVLICAW